MIKKNNNISNKFNFDLYWNIGAFGISAIIGVLLNVIIINYYSAAALGVFNQIYAIYILLSQLAVSGVHLAVQKYVPQFAEDKSKLHQIVTASLLIAAISSIIVIAVAYLFKDLPGKLTNSSGVLYGFEFVIWGLLFFSINKVLLSMLNGIREMKAFAVFQMFRFVFMLSFLLLFMKNDMPHYQLAMILPLSELVLFVLLSIYSLRFFSLNFGNGFQEQLRENFVFGNKALIGNFLFDVNTKVDILMLGFFLTDGMVGIYSIAATIAEGFLQLPVILRNNINPVLTRAYFSKSPSVINKIIKRARTGFYKLIGFLGLTTILGFPVFLLVFGLEEDFYLSWSIFAVLCLGIIFSGGYLPFQMIFNQLGHPLTQTSYIALFFFSNVVFNAICIPVFGVIGAAIGTSLAYIFQIFLLKILLKRIDEKLHI